MVVLYYTQLVKDTNSSTKICYIVYKLQAGAKQGVPFGGWKGYVTIACKRSLFRFRAKGAELTRHPSQVPVVCINHNAPYILLYCQLQQHVVLRFFYQLQYQRHAKRTMAAAHRSVKIMKSIASWASVSLDVCRTGCVLSTSPVNVILGTSC